MGTCFLLLVSGFFRGFRPKSDGFPAKKKGPRPFQIGQSPRLLAFFSCFLEQRDALNMCLLVIRESKSSRWPRSCFLPFWKKPSLLYRKGKQKDGQKCCLLVGGHKSVFIMFIGVFLRICPLGSSMQIIYFPMLRSYCQQKC